MRAVTQQEFGGPEVLAVGEVPAVAPDAGEVLLHVAAAGVNRADLLQRRGFYPPPAGESEVIGLEASGTIAAVGPGVEGWSVGQEACALLAGGGYAEQVVVPATQLLPVPRGVSLVDAAALPEVACTVWSNIVMVAGLRAGELLLVHGGASGIGTMAIQVARALGAEVAVTAGTPEKLDFCASLGAAVLIDYREEDFVARVRDATDGRGADVILDLMGAKYLQRNVETLAVGGRLVIIGMQGGTRGELPIDALLARRASVTATSLRSRSREEKAAIVAAVREHLWPLIEDGSIRPIVQSRHPLAEVAQAHAELEAGEHIGKILLTLP